jgi:hypothetical protein
VLDLASATTKGKRVLVASIVLPPYASLSLSLFSHMHALILFVCPLCYITGNEYYSSFNCRCSPYMDVAETLLFSNLADR